MGGVSAVTGHAHIASQHAADCTVVVVQNVGSGKAGENIHTQSLGLLTHPLHDIAKANDVIAMVLEAIGQQPHGGAAGAFFGQEKEFVFSHFYRNRSALRFPVRQQLVQSTRIHDGAGQDMGPHLSAFFQDTDADFLFFFLGELFQTYRGGQACRASADDNNVIFHRFTFRHCC